MNPFKVSFQSLEDVSDERQKARGVRTVAGLKKQKLQRGTVMIMIFDCTAIRFVAILFIRIAFMPSIR